MEINFLYMVQVLPELLKMVPITIFVTIISAVFSLLLGIVVTVIRIQKIKAIYQITLAYISFVRSTPIIIQLFVVFYGSPVLFATIGLDINQFGQMTFAIITLVLHNGAYLSEILKPAYFSIDLGQHEAADSIGLTSYQKISRIIAPQIARITLPSAGNMLIELIMDTSILFTIGVVELMGRAKSIISSDYGVEKITVFITVALIYWMISLAIEHGIHLIEHRYMIQHTSESKTALRTQMKLNLR